MTVDNYAHSPRHALVYGGENGAYGRGARNGNVKLNYEAKIIEAVVRAGFDEFEMFWDRANSPGRKLLFYMTM